MKYQRKIKLEETDATGVIFFSKLQSIGLECLEIFLNNHGFSVKNMIQMDLLFPIVHAEANYYLPMECGDDLEIELYLEKMGNKSVSFYLQFKLEKQKAADMRLTNVTICRVNKKAIELPTAFKEQLSQLKRKGVENETCYSKS
jgi:1,4-dihydroxy-2-naphthoyl-CoA hydrolase